MNVMKEIKRQAKLQSESCLFSLVLCLSSGIVQDGKFDSVDWGQAVSVCECWDTVREILMLLFPEEKWPDWRLAAALVGKEMKHLPIEKSFWWYRKKIMAALAERENKIKEARRSHA